MEEKSRIQEFKNSIKIVNRRRDLFPLWNKILIGIFFLWGVSGIINSIFGLFQVNPDISLYGLTSTQVSSPLGIFILLMFITKAFIAYSLWFEKSCEYLKN
ncbi:MAG: hypothetical protein Q4F57_04015 [Weeksellaceae bacterium]|nr:hypothetical protein [Weeksellaceae bacterium]